jgi:hypothetical protein
MEQTQFKISQYACAVLLIVSSIALVAYQVVMIDDVSNGLLVYIAQAFLLVASIFGLDYYVTQLSKLSKEVKESAHDELREGVGQMASKL